jgi:hypothetical protein
MDEQKYGPNGKCQREASYQSGNANGNVEQTIANSIPASMLLLFDWGGPATEMARPMLSPAASSTVSISSSSPTPAAEKRRWSTSATIVRASLASHDCENLVALEGGDKETKQQLAGTHRHSRRHVRSRGPPAAALPSDDDECLKRIYKSREIPVQLSAALESLKLLGISVHELSAVFCSLSHDEHQSVLKSELEALANGRRIIFSCGPADAHFPLPELRVALATCFQTMPPQGDATMDFLSFSQALAEQCHETQRARYRLKRPRVPDVLDEEIRSSPDGVADVRSLG